MAPIGNTERENQDSQSNKCDICGSLVCVSDEHTDDTYCLCEDSTIATGDPPECSNGTSSSSDFQQQSGMLGSGIKLPIAGPGPQISSDTDKQAAGDNPPIAPPQFDLFGINSQGWRKCPTVEVCKGVNCGEAGCTCDPVNWKPVCICAYSGKPPDQNYMCPYEVENPINSSHILQGPAAQPIDIFGSLHPSIGDQASKPENNASSQQSTQRAVVVQPTVPAAEPQSMSSHHIRMLLQITIPVFLSALVIGVLIMVLLWRRKVRLHNRKPKTNKNVVSWIQNQDQVHLLDNMTVVGKNPIYLGLDTKTVQLKGIQTTYIPQGSLKLMDVIGEGAFGKVHKGTVKWTDKNTSPVAVKILKEDASNETREDFVREVKIMSSFDHPNILKLIGVVTTENHCPYMVFEYMEFGDLTDLLRCNDPYSGKGPKLEIKQNELVDIATQIANGMVYLASKHFIHRDLATRNCLVGSELVVKISDFGMSRDIYTCDYYKIGGSRMLPVRWMSAESIKYGRFTSESDVWSYGVVLWEIFAFGKQPYYGHTNEEVIRLIDDGILLQRPQNCPDTVYHVMLGCWRKNPKDRFTFERIHKHLKDYNRTMVICYQPSPMESNTDVTAVENI